MKKCILIKKSFAMVSVLILISACNKGKDVQIIKRPEFPNLNSVEYSDDFGTVNYKEQFAYSPIDSVLLGIQINYKTTSGNTGNYSYRIEKAGSIINYRSYGADGQVVPYSLTTYTIGSNKLIASASYKTRDNTTRIFSYDYSEGGFLKKISVTEEGKITHLREYYYGNENVLDSCVLFQYHNNLPKKATVSIFEYDKSKLNTLGNYYMMQGLVLSNIIALKAFGREQKYALKKETDYRFDDNIINKLQEFLYDNIYNARNYISQRNAKITAYGPPGSGSVFNINRTYRYVYN